LSVAAVGRIVGQRVGLGVALLFGDVFADTLDLAGLDQRNYEVGFNRAGRIMMQLERAGIVGRQQGAKPRDILYHDLPSLEAKLQELGLF
jgi:hypothetical protein